MDEKTLNHAIKIFLCCAHEDEDILKRLKTYLHPLEISGKIQLWHDREIRAGTEWKQEVYAQLDATEIFLPFISSDFFASDYCYKVVMAQAFERYQRGKIIILPIIVRAALWQETPLHDLHVLPHNAEPIISNFWHSIDEALENIAQEILPIVENLIKSQTEKQKKQKTVGQANSIVEGVQVQREEGEPASLLPLKMTRRTMIVFGAITGTISLIGGSTIEFLHLHQAGKLKIPVRVTPPPMRATLLSPLGSLLFQYKYSDVVYSVAWSPDNKHIASADRTVQVWNADGSGLSFTYKEHSNTAIYSVAWSPNGKHIAFTSGDVPVQVWNADGSGHPFFYKGHTYYVYSVAWSPDSKRVASESADTTVQIWNIDGSGHTFIYKGHSDSVYSVAWSFDGGSIASASADKTVQIWNIGNNTPIFVYKKHSGVIYSVAWSPDGKYIASASADKTVHIWNVDGSEHPFIYKGHSDAVYSVAWSPDGKHIASASADTTVQVWSIDGREHPFIYTNHANSVYSVAWSPDGKRIASASFDKTVQIWSTG